MWKRKSSGRGSSSSDKEMRERLIPAAGGVPQGYVAVLVGVGNDEAAERVVVDVRALLEAAQREFGFHQEGMLRIPCASAESRLAVAAGGHRCRAGKRSVV